MKKETIYNISLRTDDAGTVMLQEEHYVKDDEGNVFTSRGKSYQLSLKKIVELDEEAKEVEEEVTLKDGKKHKVKYVKPSKKDAYDNHKAGLREILKEDTTGIADMIISIWDKTVVKSKKDKNNG